MNRKLVLRFCSVVASFASFFGNIAYSFSEEALKLALENAKSDCIVGRTFLERIPHIEAPKMSWCPNGFHSVRNYCCLLGCKREDLEHLLRGKICGNYVDNEMINDFMGLAQMVKQLLSHYKVVNN